MQNIKRFTLLLAGLIPLVSQAQVQGTVVYDEVRKLEFHFDGPEGDKIRSQMPESINSQNLLTFNSDATVFKNKKDETAEDIQELNGAGDGANMMIKIQRPESFVFRDLSKNELTESRDFFGKKFLISDSKTQKWKLVEGSKTILNYTCKKAEMTIEERDENVVAWYTSEIPISSGPATFGSLPGLILEVDIDNGKTMQTASSIDIGKIDDSILKAPKSGKKVNRDEFIAIVKERMAEQAEMSGGRGVMIKTIETRQ